MKKMKLDKLLFGLGGGAVFFIFLFLGTIIFNAWRNLGDDKITLAVTRWTRLPAGSVNGNIVAFADYAEDLSAVRKFYRIQTVVGFAAPSSDELKKSVWNRLVSQVILAEEAKKTGAAVAAEELEGEYRRIVEEAGSSAALEEKIKELYGWDGEKFKKKIIYPVLLRQKVEEIGQSEEGWMERKIKEAEIKLWIKI